MSKKKQRMNSLVYLCPAFEWSNELQLPSASTAAKTSTKAAAESYRYSLLSLVASSHSLLPDCESVTVANRSLE